MHEAIFTVHLGNAELEAIADAITPSPNQLWCSRDAEAACLSLHDQQPPRVFRGEQTFSFHTIFAHLRSFCKIFLFSLLKIAFLGGLS